MEDYVIDKYFNNLPYQKFNLTYGYNSIYLYIPNSTKRLDMIKQANKSAAVLGHIESDSLGVNKDQNDTLQAEEDQRNDKSEYQYNMEDQDK